MAVAGAAKAAAKVKSCLKVGAGKAAAIKKTNTYLEVPGANKAFVSTASSTDDLD